MRPATPADAAQWLRLRVLLWPGDEPSNKAEHAREIGQYFGGQLKEPLEVLVAEDASGAILGFVELNIRNYAEDCVTDRVAYLEGWYVVPEARRQGVGRALVQAAEDWGRRQGCTEFGSDALIDNHLSHLAHQALGFEETARIRTYRKSLVYLQSG